MPHRGLENAVKDGVINQSQAELLKDYLTAISVQAAIANPAREETVDAIRGFHDVFLSIGILCLVVGIYALNSFIGLFLGPILIWGMAEALRGWHSTRLPTITLASCFAGATAFCGLMLAETLDMAEPAKDFQEMICSAGFAIIGTLLFLKRFKTPFAWLLLAASIVLFIYALLALQLGEETIKHYWHVFFLCCGISIFIAAMGFDSRDPLRTKPHSDIAFWLHLGAAPLVVNGVMNLNADYISSTVPAALVTIGLVLSLACLALIVDRRAILVSALIYLGISVADLTDSLATELDSSFAFALIIVGMFVILVASSWQTARQKIVNQLPLWLHPYLPPVRKNHA